MASLLYAYKNYTLPKLNNNDKFVLIDLSNPAISLYKIDYMLIHWDEMIRRELLRDSDVTNTVPFQKFLSYVAELKRIVIESRAADDNTAAVPFGTAKKIYACTTTKFTSDMQQKLKTAISNNTLNPKIYTITMDKDPQLAAYGSDCTKDDIGIKNLVDDIIIPTNQLWSDYQLSLADSDKSDNLDNSNNAYETFSKTMNDLMIRINNSVVNEDYDVRYGMMEELLTSNVNLLNNLITSADTEFNIINNTLDVGSYYDRIDFKISNIDPALIIPSKLEADLVDTKLLENKMKNDSKKYSNMARSSLIDAASGRPSSGSDRTNTDSISTLSYQLLDVKDINNNLVNPPKQLEDLALTTIYNIDNNQYAKYLTSAEKDLIANNEAKKQAEYLERFQTTSAMTNNGVVGESILQRYNKYYPNQKVFSGGCALDNVGTTNSMINENSLTNINNKQRHSITQSGGREIVMGDLVTDKTQSVTTINEINTETNRLTEALRKQSELYFDNENFVDINNLQQRNELLIEMMNIVIVSKFMIGTKSSDYSDFYAKLVEKLNVFKINLDRMWSAMSNPLANIDSESPILSNLMASGIVTKNEIQELLNTINIDSINLSTDEMINSAKTLQIVSELVKKFGLNNMGAVVRNLQKIINTPYISNHADQPVEQLYRDLNQFYLDVQSLNTAMSTEYQSLSATIGDMGSINKFIGGVIESNIVTANFLAKELIVSLQNFSINTDLLQKIHTEMTRAKSRISDFDLYMKDTEYTLMSKNRIGSQHNKLVETITADTGFVHNFTPAEISGMYSTYVTDYGQKIASAASNITKYHSYDSEYLAVDNSLNVLDKAMLDYNVVMSTAKLGITIISPSKIKTSSNMDTNFNNLSTTILDYINQYGMSATSELPVFSQLMAQINVPAELNMLFDKYLASRPSNLRNIINKYLIETASNGNVKLKSYPGLTTSDQYKLIDDVVGKYIQYNNVVGKYGSNSTISSQLSAKNTTIKDNLSKFQLTRSMADLKKLIDNFDATDIGGTNGEAIKADISKYLLSVTPLKDTNSPDFVAIRDKMISQLNTVTTGTYILFHEKITNLYNLFEALSLTNNTKNIQFNEIKKRQHELSTMQFIPKLLKSANLFERLNNTPKLLRPNINGENNTNTNITGNDYTLFVHNEMNTRADGYYFGNVDRSHEMGYTRELYDNFASSALPLLYLLQNLINSGSTVKNNHSDTIRVYPFSILSDKNNRYVIPVEYQTIHGTSKISDISLSGKRLYITDNDGASNTLFGPSGSLIPDYNKISVKIISSSGKATYEINVSAYFYIPLNNISAPNIKINTGNTVNQNDVAEFVSLVVVGKAICMFMDELDEVIDDLSTLKIEDSNTWDKSITSTDSAYESRANTKTKLVNAMKVISHINNTINKIPGMAKTYLEALTKPLNKYDSGLITKVMTDVNNILPSQSTFNDISDRAWLFARKLAVTWYSMLTYMHNSLILNRTVNETIYFIRIMSGIDIDKYTNINRYGPYISSLNNYYGIINSEISKKRDQISKMRNNYPIDIGVGSKSTNAISADTINKVKFGDFYSNMETDSANIYLMLALIKDNTEPVVKESMINIATESADLVNLVKIGEKYLQLDTSNIFFHIGIPTIYDQDELINSTNNIITLFSKMLELDLNSINAHGLSNTISADIKTGSDNLGAIYTSLDTDSVKDLTDTEFLSISAKIMDLGKKFTREMIVSRPPFALPWYKLLLKVINTNNSEQAYKLYIRLLVTDLYCQAYKHINQAIKNIGQKIGASIAGIKVTAFGNLRTAIVKYLEKNAPDMSKIFGNYAPLNFMPLTLTNNTNYNNVKAIVFYNFADRNSTDRMYIDEIYNEMSDITYWINSNLYDYYRSEVDNYQKLSTMNNKMIESINTTQLLLKQQHNKIRKIMSVINLVMFNDHFKDYAYVNNSNLLGHISDAVNNTQSIKQLINSKNYSIVTNQHRFILVNSQINNYIAFLQLLGKSINGTPITEKSYKTMSFGLLEYYYDILDTVVTCLENKPYEDMADIESYLYTFHYIQLKRCHELFKWLRFEYLPFKQLADAKNMRNGIVKPQILKHKIELSKATGDVGQIFGEFNALRRFLDEYSAVVMEKVQLHLRINDFYTPNIQTYNTELKNNSNGRDYDFMVTYDPTKPEYREKWDSGKMMFYNKKNKNTLTVNFDLLDKIYRYDNNTSKNFDTYYNAVYKKMKPDPIGIDFQRIYNVQQFPESDVISNYMSIAPNIMNNKGTVIMTYGYSGVGKTVSLFGAKNPPTNGILQATLDPLKQGTKIYLRVFEIYGLGAQYNYYWNPTVDGTPSCYPNFYQMIIHHVIDTSKSQLETVDRIAFTNRHDMMSYILDLKDPARTAPGFTVNNVGDVNLAGNYSYSDYFNSSNQMIKSSYVEIKEEHYRYFSEFIKSIDNARIDGINVQKLLKHVVKQIKSTVNNPESSRSIVVYDFEIALDPAKNIYVPFMIYDLPGKEDIGKTFVMPSLTNTANNIKKSVFADTGDVSLIKEKKSTYVLNPLLMPIFDTNTTKIARILTEVSHNSSSGTYPVLNQNIELLIIKDILAYKVTNFGYVDHPDADDYVYADNHNSYTISDLYENPDAITSFIDLVDTNKFALKYITGNVGLVANSLLLDLGIIGPIEILTEMGDRDMDDNIANGTGTASDLVKLEFTILIQIVVIAFLIKYGLFDLIIEFINAIVANSSEDDTDGSWTRTKIYAFYEAYYINENVIGLLQYLIGHILKKDSDIQTQSTINETISDAINKNYQTANRYRILKWLKERSEEYVSREYGLKVSPDTLIDNNDPLKRIEITEFKQENDVNSDGKFAMWDTKTEIAYNRMNNTIGFENGGNYDTNKIFRNGSIASCSAFEPNNQSPPPLYKKSTPDKYIINPENAIDPTKQSIIATKNNPLIQDFIEPYEQKISYYYVFYVLSNNQARLKAEEQVKLLNNSMPFITKMDPASKKKTCAR